jgi:hypothetical protein
MSSVNASGLQYPASCSAVFLKAEITPETVKNANREIYNRKDPAEYEKNNCMLQKTVLRRPER